MFCCSSKKKDKQPQNNEPLKENLVAQQSNENQSDKQQNGNIYENPSKDEHNSKYSFPNDINEEFKDGNDKIIQVPVLKKFTTPFPTYYPPLQYIPSSMSEIPLQFFDQQQLNPEQENLVQDEQIEESDNQGNEDDALYKWCVESFELCDDDTKVNKIVSNRLLFQEKIFQRVMQFKPLAIERETRNQYASKNGGKECKNEKFIKTIRKIGKQIVKQIGRQILTGNFNLTTVSFPIKAMIPKSALEKALGATCLFPLYINRATQITDPIERLKLVICATIGIYYINCAFIKPLNPVVGETIEAHYPDGTLLYGEQISHHPPINYFLAYGPDKSYKYYGYYNYVANAGLNSVSLKNKGKRVIEFANGQHIEYNIGGEEYSGSFWGTMKVEVKGKINFVDRKNDLQASLEFDNVSRKPSDFFSGDIKVSGKKMCKIYGSYMGFIEFDGARYWDCEYIQPYPMIIDKSNLQSDHAQRKGKQNAKNYLYTDRQKLIKCRMEEAQFEKEELEKIQRQDSKLRKNYSKGQSKK